MTEYYPADPSASLSNLASHSALLRSTLLLVLKSNTENSLLLNDSFARDIAERKQQNSAAHPESADYCLRKQKSERFSVFKFEYFRKIAESPWSDSEFVPFFLARVCVRVLEQVRPQAYRILIWLYDRRRGRIFSYSAHFQH